MSKKERDSAVLWKRLAVQLTVRNWFRRPVFSRIEAKRWPGKSTASLNFSFPTLLHRKANRPKSSLPNSQNPLGRCVLKSRGCEESSLSSTPKPIFSRTSKLTEFHPPVGNGPNGARKVRNGSYFPTLLAHPWLTAWCR